jgi:hypothetical protein
MLDGTIVLVSDPISLVAAVAVVVVVEVDSVAEAVPVVVVVVHEFSAAYYFLDNSFADSHLDDMLAIAFVFVSFVDDIVVVVAVDHHPDIAPEYVFAIVAYGDHHFSALSDEVAFAVDGFRIVSVAIVPRIALVVDEVVVEIEYYCLLIEYPIPTYSMVYQPNVLMNLMALLIVACSKEPY